MLEFMFNFRCENILNIENMGAVRAFYVSRHSGNLVQNKGFLKILARDLRTVGN